MTASSSEALFPWVCTASYSVFSWEPRLEVDGPAKDMLANSGLQSSSYCVCSSGMSIWKRSSCTLMNLEHASVEGCTTFKHLLDYDVETL